MICQLTYGDPIRTEAVTAAVPETDRLTHFRLENAAPLTFTCPLDSEDMIFGLGETMRGMDKRGWRYVSFNYDDPHHRQDMPSLYASHNFFVVDGASPFGAFFDTPARVVFDMDSAGEGRLTVTCDSPDLRLYLIDGGGPEEIVRQFLAAIGQSYLPPLWAFGYGQSRWGYKDQKDIDQVARGYRQADIPLDYICMDIDYMDRFMDFTVSKERFPDLPGYVAKLRREGLHLVPIVDAGIKIELGDPVYDQGVAKGYFCKNKEGRDFQAEVWPGMTHFPDFLRPEVRTWFGEQYRFYTDQGLDGFWNDMNEPAIFSTEYRPKPDPETADPYARYPEDYRDFFHTLEDGRRVCHEEVHNIYGYLMTRASGEGLTRLTDKRYLLFSRSSYIGAHRYGGIWTGDNASTWEMLRQNVYQMPGLNMCGFLYSGADTGGFGGDAERELLLRWLAFSLFTPLMRNHSAKGTRDQECYRFEGVEDFRTVISLRYRLLPYLYSEFMKAALRGEMFIRPMAFVYGGDARARKIEDQLLVGESILIAPVLEEGASGRAVYLPEAMTEVRWSPAGFSCAPAEAGERWVTVPLNEVVFYIRPGKLAPVGPGGAHTAGMNLLAGELLGDGESYLQYVDDGYTRDCRLDRCVLRRKK